jgi:hypothetical protein
MRPLGDAETHRHHVEERRIGEFDAAGAEIFPSVTRVSPPSSRHSTTRMPAAARPAAVSSTWVVRRASELSEQPME